MRPCLECGVPIHPGHDCYFFPRLYMQGLVTMEPIVIEVEHENA
jgi:hypothetical protein